MSRSTPKKLRLSRAFALRVLLALALLHLTVLLVHAQAERFQFASLRELCLRERRAIESLRVAAREDPRVTQDIDRLESPRRVHHQQVADQILRHCTQNMSSFSDFQDVQYTRDFVLVERTD